MLHSDQQLRGKLSNLMRNLPDSLRYPAMLRMMIGVGLACAAALSVLLLSPLLLSYGSVFGIPQLASLTAFLNALAIVVLITSLPLGWALSLAGLTLEWLTRYKVKRKRKAKRNLQWSAMPKSRSRLKANDPNAALARLAQSPVADDESRHISEEHRGGRGGIAASE